ncbi:MAG: hypothetical protein ABI551_12285 [Polyangiaceae bacterium]
MRLRAVGIVICCIFPLFVVPACSSGDDSSGGPDAGNGADAAGVGEAASSDARPEDGGTADARSDGAASDGGAGGASPTLADLFDGKAHIVPDQVPASVPGSLGHREAFAVERTDLGANTIYLYHRCFSSPGGVLSIDICLDVSSDSGKTFPVSHGIVVHQTLGHFAVAPSVRKIGAVWTMVWEEGGAASGTYWAESTDGITWASHGALFAGTTYNATPSLYEFQNVVYVFSAQRRTESQLGITFHSGPSMKSLVQYGGGFVLAPTAAWNGGSVSMPRIVYQGGTHFMIFEGATKDLGCGNTSAEENDYGWGIAKSTTLTSWTEFSGNPIEQGDDAESCGDDMPQPLLRQNGDFFVYHTSDNVSTVERDTLAFGSACGAGKNPPDWREKNFVCMPSCGGVGGTACYQTKDCTTGAEVNTGIATFPGMTNECVSCCH